MGRCRFLLATVLAFTLTMRGASAAEADDRAPSSAAEAKAVLQRLIQSSWDLESYRGWWLRDMRGKTPDDDLRAYILADSDMTTLRSLIATAETQESRDDQGGLRLTLQKANAVLARELANSALFFWYWGDRAGNTYHRQLIEGLWSRMDATSAASARASLEAAERPLFEKAASILNSVKANLFAVGNAEQSEIHNIQLQLSRIYGDERQRVVKELNAVARDPSVQLHARNRRGACTPAQETSHNQRATLIEPVERPVYSAYARRVGFAGKVAVRVFISELGCIDRVEIEKSSGAPELDESALDWGEQELKFLPAEIDGKAVATERVLAVTFDLKD
jgi:TonB family protein